MSDITAEGLPARGAPEIVDTKRRRWMFRHPFPIRLCHWVNVVAMAVLLMSGLQIFNAHPALYWGNASSFDHPWAMIGADTDAQPPKGIAVVAGHSFTTTGVLGLSPAGGGEMAERGFPQWATLPADQDLATGRRWHFFFAWVFVINGALYLLYGLLSGQARARYLPTGGQLRHIGASVLDHLRLRFGEGEDAKRYNVLQKLTYLVVVFGLIPTQVLAGLAMSPALDSAAPWLLTLFGGRQSARTVHFIVAALLLGFVVVHVLLVVLAGPFNTMRGMITGWSVIGRRGPAVPHDEA